MMYDLDYVQLHGHESLSYCRALKSRADIGIIKVFSGNDLPDSEELVAYGQMIDFYLFDTRNESYGGTGQKFDWSVLEALNLRSM